MAPMIIAVLIIALISWFFIAFRAYASFNLIVIGFCMTVVPIFGGDNIFLSLGIPMLVGGILIIFLTSLKAEPSARGRYMVHLFLYGFFMFLRIVFICTLIAIPFISVISAMAADYKEMVVVDCRGVPTGERVIVDKNTMKGIDGKRYKDSNDLY